MKINIKGWIINKLDITKENVVKYFNYVNEKPVSFIFNVVIFISSIATIFAVIFGVSQIRLANEQLKELNSKAEIRLRFNLASSTFSYGPKYTEPFGINIAPRNIGDYDTSSWVAVIIFCKSTKIISADTYWKNVDPSNLVYILKSDSIVTKDQALFSSDIDSVGKFVIAIPKNDATIPIGFIHTSGQRTQIHTELISFDWKNISNKSFLGEPFFYNDRVDLPTSSSTCLKGSFDPN